MSFRQAAEQYIDERRSSWRNIKHAQQWENTLKTYACPVIGNVQVTDVDKARVLKIIKPMWSTKTETANRVRDRIKLVLSWAKAHGLRDGESPAEWRGNLEHALAVPAKVARPEHQPALPVDAVGAFIACVHREQHDLAAKALEFAILTAARDGEVRGATWSEVDLVSGICTIPADRMKAERKHRVPLSPAALNLLKDLPRSATNAHLFPGSGKLGRLSENTLNERDQAQARARACPFGCTGPACCRAWHAKHFSQLGPRTNRLPSRVAGAVVGAHDGQRSGTRLRARRRDRAAQSDSCRLGRVRGAESQRLSFGCAFR
jgi:integrase